MTKRLPVSNIQNQWFDAEQVDNDDLNIEQNYNNATQFGLINNHIGSGVLPSTLTTNVLFDSAATSGLLDGAGVAAQSQPSDTNFGNQLAITLTGSAAAGRKRVKVGIIGLDFQGNLQYDTFFFHTNETQYTKKHYTHIATLLFNDFIGNASQSFNLGGRIVISEAPPFTLSRDTVMVAQDVEPNLFFRDFFVTGFSSLTPMLQAALPLFNIDNLNIKVGFKENQILPAGNVTMQIGEKFLATTNNIQKVTLLLSVQNLVSPSSLVWSGNLVISIVPLQTSLSCPADIVPNLAIDFPPSNIPVAQISVSYNSLQAAGVQLDGNPQPVDFIFSNTAAGNGTGITPDNYYVVTATRSGDTSACDILLAAGSADIPNSRVTVFTGNLWVDIPEDNLWFKVYTDAAKITDGQAYETGHGIIIPKTAQTTSLITSSTGAQIATTVQTDYNLSAIQFSGNGLNTAIVQATLQESDLVQNQKTGNPTFSRQQFIPTVKLLNSIDLANLLAVSEPFAVGTIQDANQKTFSTLSNTINSMLHGWTFVDNQVLLKVITDTTDPRYDQSVNDLVTNFVDGDFIDAKIIPDGYNTGIYYRIANTQLCSMIYGDVNGDGVIDGADLTILNSLIGTDLTTAPPLNSQITTGGGMTTVVNGYNMYVHAFVSGTSLTWQLVDPNTTNIISSGVDGYLTADPNNPSLAVFGSVSTDFSAVSNLTDLNLVILGAPSQADNGSFTIVSLNLNDHHIINIQKLYYTPDIFKQIFRADLDGNYKITSNDGYLLQSYIEKTIPFPPNAQPSLKIGTSFNVLSFTVEPFLYTSIADGYLDRTDDFPSTQPSRATTLHATQDIFINDTFWANHNFTSTPVPFSIIKQQYWEEYVVAATSDARFVPTVFTSEAGLILNSCDDTGVSCEQYPIEEAFDPGRIDVFVPNNLILGNGGQLLSEDGYYYPVDFEVGTVNLEIPTSMMGTERSINIHDVFVADYTGAGVTRFGYRAMRYADCSFVQPNDIFANRVHFSVSMQSLSPNLDGYTIDGYSGVIVDDRAGIWIDYTTGILKLNFANLFQDPVLLTLNTKIQVNVFLKKAGFNNPALSVTSDVMANLFNLIT